MKLKLALLAATLALTGCQMPVGPIYNQSEVGNIRTQAEVDARTGTLQWHNGTGVVYTRTPMQCGKNCAAQAELAAQLDKEKAEREAAGNPEWERIVAREKEAYRIQDIQNKCARVIDRHLGLLRDRYMDSLQAGDYEAAQKAGAALNNGRKKAISYINKCVEENK